MIDSLRENGAIWQLNDEIGWYQYWIKPYEMNRIRTN